MGFVPPSYSAGGDTTSGFAASGLTRSMVWRSSRPRTKPKAAATLSEIGGRVEVEEAMTAGEPSTAREGAGEAEGAETVAPSAGV